MCKIYAMTNMSKVKLTPEFIKIVRDAVCKTVDRDGFGYAVNTSQGDIWGERVLNPFDFNPFEKQGTSVVSRLPIVNCSNSFGNVGQGDAVSFIAHGRMSTNQVNIDNTHPFVNDEIALIHNGVVSDPNGIVTASLKTTCDTEILLRLWEQGEIDAIESNAAGYYAIAALDRHGQLHIARDSRAQLFISWSETVESYIIATTEDIIKDVSFRMNWKIEEIKPITSDTYAVFQGNELSYHRKIEPIGYVTTINSSLIQASLGETDLPCENELEYLSGDYEAFQRDWREDLNSDDMPDYDDSITDADYEMLYQSYAERRRVG